MAARLSASLESLPAGVTSQASATREAPAQAELRPPAPGLSAFSTAVHRPESSRPGHCGVGVATGVEGASAVGVGTGVDAGSTGVGEGVATGVLSGLGDGDGLAFALLLLFA
jgi:hypothetical protein